MHRQVRRLVPYLVLCFVFSTALSAGLAADGLEDVKIGRLPQPHPDAPEEMKQFSFLVGEFDCELTFTGQDGAEVRSRGRWVGYYTLDGHAFQDDWYSELGYRGTTWRSYDEAKGRWVNNWLMAGTDEAPGFVKGFFYGNMSDGEMVLEARGTDTRGAYINRIKFSEIQASGFVWSMSRSYDGGQTWIENIAVNRARRVSKTPAG